MVRLAALAGLAALLCGAATPVRALTDTLIEAPLARAHNGQPVVIRAILTRPDPPNQPTTALLYFRGGHGIAKIESIADRRRNLPLFIGPHLPTFLTSGIALVAMDCPTDQWGTTDGSNRATSCLDDYRSSPQHADDVRGILARLRDEFGFRRLIIMGHSKGSLSSRWLAIHLGSEIEGSIHSASMSQPDPWGNGKSIAHMTMDRAAAPLLYIHHRYDACVTTSYAAAREASGGRIVTVHGGTPSGNACTEHYHSYKGREELVAKTLAGWIARGEAPPTIGE